MTFSIRTWHAELTFVATVLFGAALARGARWTEWIGAAAVLASFAHAQVTDRLAEHESARLLPAVACWRMALLYFVAKEVLWVCFFVMTGAWSALAGCAVFLLYPVWRKWWRRRHPLPHNTADGKPVSHVSGRER